MEAKNLVSWAHELKPDVHPTYLCHVLAKSLHYHDFLLKLRPLLISFVTLVNLLWDLMILPLRHLSSLYVLCDSIILCFKVTQLVPPWVT